MNPNEQCYTAVAIDETATQACAIAAFQLHKSIGLTVLLLTALRLLWWSTHKPPPAGMARRTCVCAAWATSQPPASANTSPRTR